MLAWINFITRLLNDWFGAPIDALLNKLGIHPVHPSHPINNTLTLELIVFSGTDPVLHSGPRAAQRGEAWQRAAPGGDGPRVRQRPGRAGDGARIRALPSGDDLPAGLHPAAVTASGCFPGVDTPTANPSVPLGLALFTFAYYNWNGVRAQGPIGYLKHFMGPVWWIAPLMFPIEIISHFARILSLTVRLFANMLASDMIDDGLLLADPAGGAHRLSGPALVRGHHPGLHLHAAHHDLPGEATSTGESLESFPAGGPLPLRQGKRRSA